MDDSYKLNRFVRAQESSYAQALSEIQVGRKRSNWMRFIFPQFYGLGSSPASRFYEIKSLEEAKAYLAHPVLGPRLLACADALMGIENHTSHEIFGSLDDLKLKSSLTLFAAASPEGSVFDQLLGKYYQGKRDPKTDDLLEKSTWLKFTAEHIDSSEAPDTHPSTTNNAHQPDVHQPLPTDKKPRLETKTLLNRLFRWIAVLPGALLAVFAVMFPIHWVVMLQYRNTSDYSANELAAILSPQTLELFAHAFFTPFILIAVGARIAPKFKFATGIALAVLGGIFYGWIATVIVGQIQQGIYTPARWLRLGITVLLCVTGLVVGLIQAHKVGQQELTARMRT